MATVARERSSPARTERSQNCRSSSRSVIPRSPLSISHAVVRAISLSSIPSFRSDMSRSPMSHMERQARRQQRLASS